MRKQRERILIGTILILLILLGISIYNFYQKDKQVKLTMATSYNMAFNELVGYVQNIENYLAKATISSDSKHGAETLTEVWRQADIAVSYLAQIPLNTEELTKTAKFLNQVSEYSYALSRKNINNEDLTQEDLDNLEMLHNYSLELKDSLNQMLTELNNGTLSWEEITKNKNTDYVKQVDNVSIDSLVNIDNNFNEYAGLIYDGAFSEHIQKMDKKGLTGDDVTEEQAKQAVKDFIGQEKIEDISLNAFIENGDIPVYDFSVELKDNENTASISISKKGGKVVIMNIDRDVDEERISREDANEIGKSFLSQKGFENMKETYYQTEDNVITINYAYTQEEVTIYPDLIKLKIALDNGDILGIETNGYLNSHTEREIPEAQITIEEAKLKLNPRLSIESEGLAIIPTEWKTEIFCYEFKGKVEETEFLVYINAETGDEENILVIIETPGGILTK
ncbi:MAG: germination protein YpeB [Clostridia bacterium]|nr:germination protein YpeB [Clostridia bacterium]